MSDIAKLKKLIEQQNNISKNLPEIGIVSMRLPTAHERQMAWAKASADCGGLKNAQGCVIAAKRTLMALCLYAWSVTPRALLADRAPEEGADEVIPISSDAAELFFDCFPEHYEALAEYLMSAIAEREKTAKDSEKKS